MIFTVNVELLSFKVTQMKFLRVIPLKKRESVPNIYLRDHKIVWKCSFCKEMYSYIDFFSDYTFETPYVIYNLWFFYLIKHLRLYGDFVFQVIIKCSRLYKYVSKVLRCESHSGNIALPLKYYLIANTRRITPDAQLSFVWMSMSTLFDFW